MKATEALKITKAWYSYAGVPAIDEPRFLQFAGRAAAIISEVSDKIACEFRFVIKQEAAAYIDFNSKVICMPLFYFMRETFSKYTDEADEAALLSLALVNGSSVHEAKHSVHSKYIYENIEVILGKRWMIDYPFGWKIAGVLEDLFIEGTIEDKDWRRLFVDAKNAILIGEMDKSILDEVSRAEPNKDVELFIRVLIDLKNVENRAALRPLLGHLTTENETVDAIMNGARYYKATEKRARAFADIIRQFGSEFADSDSAPAEGKEAAEKGVKATPTCAHNKAHQLVEAEGDEDFSQEAVASAGAIDSESASEIVQQIETALNKEVQRIVEENRQYTLKEREGKLRQPEFNPVVPFTRGDKVILPGNWDAFAKHLKALTTKKADFGVPAAKGPKIVNTRLARIATDGKIFAYKAEREEKAIEVMVLVDLSGSTDGYAEASDGSSEPIWRRELSAAYGMFNSLRNVNVPVEVLGFTSLGCTPKVIEIASYQMQGKQTPLDSKSYFVGAAQENRQGNHDGCVIRECVKRFSKRNSKKILIVLSDGEPFGPEYEAPFSTRHTMEIIARVRKYETLVFSLSVTRSVVEANDKIYGKEWNIDAPKDLNLQMQKLIERITTKGQ